MEPSILNDLSDNNQQDNGAVPSGDNSGAGAGTDYSLVFGENGSFAENWKSVLPEELQGEKCLDNVKDFGNLVKNYVSAQKMIGQKGVTVPGENSTPEEWDSFYAACGRPENPEAYTYDVESLPEGVSLDPETMKSFREFAFKNGLSQKSFAEAVAFDVERTRAMISSEVERINQEYETTRTALQQSYGEQYKNKLAIYDSTLKKFGLSELVHNSGLQNNLQLVKAVISIGEKLGEARLPGNGAFGGASPDQRLRELTGNLSGPYYDNGHPDHDAVVAEVAQLLASKRG